MNPISACLLAPLFFGLVAATLSAQPEPVPSKPVKVEFKAVAIGRGITQAGVVQTGGKVPLYIPAYGLSQAFHYEGPRDLVFVQTQLKDGANRDIPVATATLPSGVAKVFILLTPSSLSPGQFTTQVVSDLLGDGAEGVADVVNLSSRAIRMGLNGSPSVVPAGKSLRVPLVKGRISVVITQKHKQSEDEPDLCRETYTAPEGGRLTLLISNASATQSAEDEAVTIIPLAEEAARVAPLKP